MKKTHTFKEKKRGILLVNVGTPPSTEVKDVRAYLKEFLWDKRILDVSWLLRAFLLFFIILPFRSKRSAKLYEKIWTSEGSPLLVWSRRCAQKLTQRLNKNRENKTVEFNAPIEKNFEIELGMAYGKPALSEGLQALMDKNCEHIVILPLFPQYSASTTAGVIEVASKFLNAKWYIPPYSIVGSFFQHPLFIQAWKERIEETKQKHNPDFILFSYHGLPIRNLKKAAQEHKQSSCLTNKNCCENFSVKNNFCYRAQCFETTRLISTACSLSTDQFTTAFQSRFGRDAWTLPNTQTILPELRSKGVRKLSVVCPGFVADCLETLEEIGIRLREEWLALGGTELVLVDSLNDNETWVSCLEDLCEISRPLGN